MILEGETGKSVSQYSAQWLQLYKLVKGGLQKSSRIDPKKVLVGISLNYNLVYGWINFDLLPPVSTQAWAENPEPHRSIMDG